MTTLLGNIYLALVMWQGLGEVLYMYYILQFSKQLHGVLYQLVISKRLRKVTNITGKLSSQKSRSLATV